MRMFKVKNLNNKWMTTQLNFKKCKVLFPNLEGLAAEGMCLKIDLLFYRYRIKIIAALLPTNKETNASCNKPRAIMLFSRFPKSSRRHPAIIIITEQFTSSRYIIYSGYGNPAHPGPNHNCKK